MVGLWPVADYFVIATGTSQRQMRTVCTEIEELAAQSGSKPFTRSGYEGQSWIVVDFIDVVVHVFSPESRQYYDLDNLWGDAPKLDWEK
jgi:ribosome-associated protein